MANDSVSNTYEEARKQRLVENKKRFEDLGILTLSKSLSELASSPKKSQNRISRSKSSNVYDFEPRRSSRPRNPVNTYQEEVDIERPSLRKRSRFNSSWASYLARPLCEVKNASYEERARAFKCAEKLQSNLQSGHPSFVKSMVRSHVYSCFWLGLPGTFCNKHLSKSTVDMVLEAENGVEYSSTFIGKRTGLSGGWRAFALDHKLDDGDALVFELVEPSRFKVYIVRADASSEEDDLPAAEDKADSDDTNSKTKTKPKTKKTSNGVTELNNNTDDDDAQPKPGAKKSKKNEESPQVAPTRRNPARKTKAL